MSQPLRILIVEDGLQRANVIESNLLEILNDLNIPRTIEGPAAVLELKTAIRKAPG